MPMTNMDGVRSCLALGATEQDVQCFLPGTVPCGPQDGMRIVPGATGVGGAGHRP